MGPGRMALLAGMMMMAGCAETVRDTPSLHRAATLVMPDIASTARWSEVRIAFSPDGDRRLWGVVRGDIAPGRLVIVESVRRGGGWSPPQRVSFGSDSNDFDPFFARDGRTLYFFSNRPGGMGGDDLWAVPFDPARGEYGTPHNLGAAVNSPGDEWAPAVSADGRTLIFSSNGHGGMGGQDLFLARRAGTGWSEPVNLGAGVNGSADDFDAAFVGDDRLVFTSGDATQGKARLHIAHRRGEGFAGRTPLGAPFDCAETLANGPSWRPEEPNLLYFSADCTAIGRGRMDIFAGVLP